VAGRYGLTARDRFPVKSRRISKQQSLSYAELSGDFNPLHLDDDYAATTEFGTAVAHGNLCLQLCFESLAEGLDVGALPAAAQLRMRFLRPVFIGDEVAFEVTSATEQRHVLLVEGECRTRGEIVAALAARIPWPPTD
jgi:3-hydroxybutyryl-CoA dehydratase